MHCWAVILCQMRSNVVASSDGWRLRSSLAGKPGRTGPKLSGTCPEGASSNAPSAARPKKVTGVFVRARMGYVLQTIETRLQDAAEAWGGTVARGRIFPAGLWGGP